MFADPYEYEETTIITQVGDANFKATGKVPTKQGWQALFDDHKADQQEQQLYRSFTKAIRLKQICKHRKKKRHRRCPLPKVP